MENSPKLGYMLLLLAYVAVVHTVDTLASHGSTFLIDWQVFSWRHESGFDVFKFLAWFAVPVAFTFRRFEAGYFGFARWKRMDVLILIGLAVVSLLALLIIPLIPDLRAAYPDLGHLPGPAKWAYLCRQLLWTISWLVGWEFLHRYVLLTAVQSRWPRLGWLAIPIIEGIYHLQKPLLETLGMIAFSLLVTPWALKRRNILLPLLAHFIIEVELIALMLVR